VYLTITEATMAPSNKGIQPVIILGALAAGVIALAYLQPDIFSRSYTKKGDIDGFRSTLSAASNYSSPAGGVSTGGAQRENAVRNAPEVMPVPSSGPADFGSAESPAGCYPRDQLTPSELLPKDSNSTWAQQNPMGTGSLKGKNFLSAGALIGVNTVGQSLRNANYQLRSEPANPQVPVSVFNVPTIEPDVNRRALEIA
jgi:hypothetical protein